MTNEEAKFMLQGYRPNGADCEDEAFAEALKQAQNDPTLKDWFEREQAFDALMSDKLRAVSAPDGLRESILAGTRISSPVTTPKQTAWWRQPWGLGLAIAASVVLVFSLVSVGPLRTGDVASLDASTVLFEQALADYNGAHPQTKHADMLGGFGAWLENPENALTSGAIPTDLEALRQDGCRTVDVAGHEVFEICFRRGGKWYHVYFTPRTGFDTLPEATSPDFLQQEGLVATSWVDDNFVYLLSSTTGFDDLRGLL